MEFKLPEIGEGVHEGELIKWLVKDGDTVAADQPLLEVMTDKATVEVPSPSAGTLRGITAKDGAMIKVGQVLAQIEAGAGATSTPSAKPAPAAATPPPPSAAAKPAAPTSQVSPSLAAAIASTVAKPAVAPAYQDALQTNNSSTVPAAPIVRAMARNAGVDLENVPASGPTAGGRNRVLEEDLIRFLSGTPVSASAATYANGNGATSVVGASAGPAALPAKAAKPTLPVPTRNLSGAVAADERKPVRGLRRAIANAMVKSKYTAPHYSYVDKFECSKFVEVREAAKEIGAKYGVNVTYLPFVIKAVVSALREFPEANSSLEETPNGLELVLHKNFHIGFAVASPDGLLVPVIKNADQKSILEIAKEMGELSAKVRAGKATSEELKGSTFTITSMGNVGGLFAMPIINYPEVGILGVYKVQEEAIVKDGQVQAGKNMYISASFDHRVIDGATGGYFCNAIIERLADPARLLLDLV